MATLSKFLLQSCYKKPVGLYSSLHSHLSLSLRARSTPLHLFLSRLLQFKKFPIGTACCIRFERKFFMGAKEKKVCKPARNWPAAVDRRRREREGARQTITTTTTLATENKSIQLIVCAAVKVCVCVCVCECKSLINIIFYNYSVIYVCVYVRLLVLIECNIEKIIEIEKKYEKNQIQQLQLQ